MAGFACGSVWAIGPLCGTARLSSLAVGSLEDSLRDRLRLREIVESLSRRRSRSAAIPQRVKRAVP